MKSFLSIVFILSISNLVCSQTIINAESLSMKGDSSIYSMSFSYSGSQGNLTTNQISLSPNILLMRKRNEYKVLGGYYFLSQQGIHLFHSGFIHFRHNFKINERFKTLAFYQAQFNEVLLLNQRQLFGIGFKYRLIDKDSLNLDFSAGPMREYEELNTSSLNPGEIAETGYTRANFVSSLSWKASKVFSVHHVLYYQPYLSDFTDYRVLNDLNLIVSLSKYFSLVASITTRYDNLPPIALKKTDNAVSLGLKLAF